MALEACFTSMPEGRIATDVEVTFDGLGTATVVKLTSIDGTMTPPIEKCVRHAFLAVRASCPAVPTSTATANVSATASKL